MFNNLKRIRRGMDFSQQEIAKEVCVSNATVSRWENGRTRPSPYLLHKLCDLLEKDLVDLFPDLVSDEQATQSSVGEGSALIVAPNKLRVERLRRGWSQEQMAERLQVSRITINRWEQGHYVPSRYHVRRLCKLLGKRRGELFSTKVTTHSSMVTSKPVPRLQSVEAPMKDSQETTRWESRSLQLSRLLLPSNLQKARYKRMLTQELAAEFLEVDVRTYQRWESGKAFPNRYNRQRLMDLLM
jgi:putative transcriptional regulator